MPVGCSDCGRPSVGLFDVKSRPADYDAANLDRTTSVASIRSLYDRPLCAECSTARKATPSPVAAPTSGAP